jgi:hypothetical protein
MTTFVKLATVLGLLLALLLAVRAIDQRGYQRATAEASNALQAQKREAAAVLATETAKTRAAEQALRDFKTNQDIQDAKAQSTVADLSRRLRQLADQSGRLRDPHAPGCGAGSGSAPSEAAPAASGGAEHPAEAGGLLSEQLTQFLFEQAASADDINVAYISCRADAYTVRGAPPP